MLTTITTRAISLVQVKTKSWFTAVDVMDHLCSNWTLLSTLVDHCVAADKAGWLQQSTVLLWYFNNLLHSFY